MTDFDERFADRAREVFDTYAEPVDEPTWERVQAALERDRMAARDRAPLAGGWMRRSRALVGLATLVLVAAVGTWLWQTQPLEPVPDLASTSTDGGLSTRVRPLPPEASEAEASETEVSERRTPEAEASEPEQFAHGTPARVPPRTSPVPRPRAVPSLGRQSPRAPSPERARSARSFMDAESPTAGAVAPPPARTPKPSPQTDAAEASPPVELADRAPSSDTKPEALIASGQPAVARAPGRNEESLAVEAVQASSWTGLDLVLATNAAFSGRQLAEGVGLSAGLSREWRVRRGVAVSTGALAAYTRLTTDPEASAAEALDAFESDPSRAVEIPNQTTLSTLAIEIPLDVLVDVGNPGPGRLRAGVGLTTSLYLSQTFEDEGTRFALDPEVSLENGGTQITTTAYSTSETAEPLSRLDLGRQANLSLGYTLDRGRTPLSVDAYTRLPLGGLTSRDLPISVVGLRLRIGL